MRTSILSLDEMQKFIGTRDFLQHRDNTAAMKKAAVILKTAIEAELTSRQKTCIELYFYRRLSMTEIGDMLGINKSTVSRHIKAAKARLKHVIAYACFENAEFFPG